MEVLTEFPLTIAERLQYGEQTHWPASWERFLELLPQCEYRIEYDGGKIISFMGYASENHELIVAAIIRLLGNLLEDPSYRISGSNLALHVPGKEKRYFNADCTVVQGPSEKVPLSQNMEAIANPVLLVEVFSPSTEDHDTGRKFRHYRQIPSLQQVLFIESTSKAVFSHTLHENGEDWLLQEFTTDDAQVPILGQGHIVLAELYAKVQFSKPNQ